MPERIDTYDSTLDFEHALSTLIDKVGPTLTAYLAGAEKRSDPADWLSGGSTPDELQRARISAGIELWSRLVREEGSEDVARALFIGTWPALVGKSPVEVIRGTPVTDNFPEALRSVTYTRRHRP